jgi:hypothetical protein
MTGAEMLTQLGRRMEDVIALTPTDGNEYTIAIKLDAINDAQLRLATMLPDEKITELEVLETGVTITAGAVTFATLGATTLAERVQMVRIGSGGIFLDPVDVSDLKDLINNSYLASSATGGGYWWINKSSIYVLPTATATVDVYHLRVPVDVANDAVACELDVTLHETVLDLAEASLWLTANRPGRSDKAESRALAYVKSIGGKI